MVYEESEYFENILSQLKNQIDEMSGSVLKLVDFSLSHEIFKGKWIIKWKILWIEEWNNYKIPSYTP
jgi:hypothetical protein